MALHLYYQSTPELVAHLRALPPGVAPRKVRVVDACVVGVALVVKLDLAPEGDVVPAKRYRVEEKPQFYVEGGGAPYTLLGSRATKKAAIALAERVTREAPQLRSRRVVDTATNYIVWSHA